MENRTLKYIILFNSITFTAAVLLCTSPTNYDIWSIAFHTWVIIFHTLIQLLLITLAKLEQLKADYTAKKKKEELKMR